jgi:hypothetical protein
MLGSSWVAVQLAASQEGLRSMNEWVILSFILGFVFNNRFFLKAEVSAAPSYPRGIDDAGWTSSLTSWSGPSNTDTGIYQECMHNSYELSISSFGEQRHQSADGSLVVLWNLNTTNQVLLDVTESILYIHPFNLRRIFRIDEKQN